MIHYHGLPITPETAAIAAVSGGHAFVSVANPSQADLAMSVCQSFAIDNGAYSAWRAGRPVKDWSAYYAWAAALKRSPNCDFAIIPDVIDGDEADNDALLSEWPLGRFFGAPVWHLHESISRLVRLAADWPRVALGSSGEYAQVSTRAWWRRMGEALGAICDADGFPPCRLHGLRMLDPRVFSRVPLSSADSTNIGRNVGIDKNWKTGVYLPATKEGRARVMRERIESVQACARWVPPDFLAGGGQLELLKGGGR